MGWSPGAKNRREPQPIRVTYADGSTATVEPDAFAKVPRSSSAQRARYAAYRRSPEWRAIRMEALGRDGFACAVCGATTDRARIEVHHRTYERFGHEDVDDLLTLCQPCHAKVHNGRLRLPD